MTPVESMLHRASTDLKAIGVRWALVGGLGVSSRVGLRFTEDVDFAVAVAGDPEAEAVVFGLRSRGYSAETQVNQEYVGRLCTARLVRSKSNVKVDLLFASSGIEQEIVAAATSFNVFPRIKAPVATIGHLIAMKILASRHQDFTDLERLIPAASSADLAQAREAVQLIRKRGFNRESDIVANLEREIAKAGR